jgi:hypothetical protein
VELMKAIRSALWSRGTEAPGTMVVMRECDMAVPVEEIAEEHTIPDTLVTRDIFEVPDDLSLEDTIDIAVKRFANTERREQNQAVAFQYWAALLPMMKAGGAIIADRPAPMESDHLVWVLKQLANHPDYNGCTITSTAEDGTIVTLSNGNVAIESQS